MDKFKRIFRILGEKFGLVSPVLETIEKPGSADDIKRWLANKVAAVLKIDASAIEFNTSFAKLGIDSLAAITPETTADSPFPPQINRRLRQDFHLQQPRRLTCCAPILRQFGKIPQIHPVGSDQIGFAAGFTQPPISHYLEVEPIYSAVVVQIVRRAIGVNAAARGKPQKRL